MNTSQIRLELRGAFEHQRVFLDCSKRYAIACSGVKAGKSICGAMYAVTRLANRPGTRGTWIAPTYQQSTGIGLEAVRGLLPPEHVGVKLSGVPTITLANGSRMEFKSADQPDNLFGTAADFAVLDEAGRISEDAFNAIRSTLTPTGGPMRLLSNPTPRTGWFFRLYSRGLDPEDPAVRSFKWKTADNPMIPACEIEDAQRNLSERTYRSLYLGEFLDLGGSVFRNVLGCATGALESPAYGRSYVGGLDLARTMDWNVATVLDESTREVVAWERWHGVSWEVTVGRVVELSKRYNRARFYVDSTGVGDVVLEMLERSGVSVNGVKFTPATKSMLVERLSALIERGRIAYPPLDVLLGELESFEASTGPSGTVRYSAPSGEHDDAVVSLALACTEVEIEEAPAIGPRERIYVVRRAVFATDESPFDEPVTRMWGWDG